MPAAIPLIGAAASIGAGISAAGGMAAIAAGGLSAIGLTSGLLIAGGTLTGVGALTGNKKLQAIGGVMSLVGGGISAFDSLTSTASSVAPSVSASASPAADAAASVAEAASSAASPAVSTAADTASAVASQAASAPSQGLLQGAMGTEFGADALGQAAMQNQAAVNPMLTTPEAMAAAAPEAVSAAAQPAATMAGPSAPMNATQYDLAQGTYSGGYAGRGPESIPGAGAPAAEGSWWNGVISRAQQAGQWLEQNPKTAKFLGEAVKGGAGYYAQMSAQEEKQKREDWLRQNYSDSVRNLRVPRLTVQRPGTAGIIGGARG